MSVTPEEVRALSDEALDKLVAETVMGVPPVVVRGEVWPTPYSSDWNAMGALIDRLVAAGYTIEAAVSKYGTSASVNWRGNHIAFVNAAMATPRAVAELAALVPIGQEK